MEGPANIHQPEEEDVYVSAPSAPAEKGLESFLRGMLGLGILLPVKLPIDARMSTTPILVRRATPSDLETVSSLFDAYRVFYEQESNPDAAKQFMEARLEKGDSVIFLALNDAEEGLGFTQLYPLFSSVRMRSIWLLNDLYVAKSARRMGVAHALMFRAQDHARETGAAGLELATAKDNDPAKALYHDLGWKLDTEFDHYSISV